MNNFEHQEFPGAEFCVLNLKNHQCLLHVLIPKVNKISDPEIHRNW